MQGTCYDGIVALNADDGYDGPIEDIETVRILPGTRIDTLSLSNVQFRNETGKPAALLRNDGSIGKLYLYDVDAGEDEVLVNGGTIGKVTER